MKAHPDAEKVLMDTEELADARWFSIKELEGMVEQDGDDSLANKISKSHWELVRDVLEDNMLRTTETRSRNPGGKTGRRYTNYDKTKAKVKPRTSPLRHRRAHSI